MEKHYQEFDDSEENKLIYTSIFKILFLIPHTDLFIFLRPMSGLAFPLL